MSKVSPYYIACDQVRITYHCHSRIYGIYQRFVYPFHLKAIASLYFLRFYLICPTCFHKWPRVCSTYVNTFQSFPHPIFITGFVTRVIRRVPLVQQNCWSFRSTWVHIVLVSFLFWPLCWLSFFDFRIMNTTLVSSTHLMLPFGGF